MPALPQTKSTTQESVFSVGDPVYMTTANGEQKGPFLIESVVGSGRYTLCNVDGTRYENGTEVTEDDLSKTKKD